MTLTAEVEGADVAGAAEGLATGVATLLVCLVGFSFLVLADGCSSARSCATSWRNRATSDADPPEGFAFVESETLEDCLTSSVEVIMSVALFSLLARASCVAEGDPPRGANRDRLFSLTTSRNNDNNSCRASVFGGDVTISVSAERL